MLTQFDILLAIPSTEPADFREFLNGLPDTPEKGDRDAWSELFTTLRHLERDGLIEVERASKGGGIESLLLTAEGVEVLRRNQI